MWHLKHSDIASCGSPANVFWRTSPSTSSPLILNIPKDRAGIIASSGRWIAQADITRPSEDFLFSPRLLLLSAVKADKQLPLVSDLPWFQSFLLSPLIYQSLITVASDGPITVCKKAVSNLWRGLLVFRFGQCGKLSHSKNNKSWFKPRGSFARDVQTVLNNVETKLAK